MIKRFVLPVVGFLLVVVLVFWLIPLHRYFPSIFGEGKTVLVLYDQPNPNHVPEDMADALMLRQLLGHFKAAKIELISSGEYQRGKAKEYDLVFYIGTKDDMPVPTYLLDDLFFRREPTVWINSNLDQMNKRHALDSYGLRLVGENDDYATNRVLYKEKQLWKLDTRTFMVEVTNTKKNRVLAWAVAEPGAKTSSGQGGYGPKVAWPGAPPAETPPTSFTELPPLPDDLNFGVDIPAPRKSETQPAVTSAGLKIPWIIRGEKLWYVASNPLSYQVEGGAYLAFCDVLHDVFNSKDKAGDHPALVRLEDVHPKRGPADLLAAADYLKSQDVPFIFTLIPVYKNPETEETIYLSNSPEFQATVKGLIARGGIPILHGYTHQSGGETAVDYEFWSATGDHPLSIGPEFMAERVIRGLSECFLADVYPLAWTTPHYAAGQIDYNSLHNYFTTVVERRQPIDRLGSDQFFPYTIYQDLYKQIIIPENLGYVQPAAGRDAQAILKDADNGLVVRDGWGSFFFHTFLDLNLLKDIVDGLKKQGYHFVSLADYNNKVRTEDTVIVSGISEVLLNLRSQYLRSFTIKTDGKVKNETFSFRPVTGEVQMFASVYPGETAVYQGVYTTPPLTFKNLSKFRPSISGVTNPIALFLLFVGLMILVTFLVIWVFLLTRKAAFEFRNAMRTRRGKQ